MSEKTILICDGCELPHTSRKPVESMKLVVETDNGYDDVIVGDAHDWNCFGRLISRKRKSVRELSRAAKALKVENTKKGGKAA